MLSMVAASAANVVQAGTKEISSKVVLLPFLCILIETKSSLLANDWCNNVRIF